MPFDKICWIKRCWNLAPVNTYHEVWTAFSPRHVGMILRMTILIISMWLLIPLDLFPWIQIILWLRLWQFQELWGASNQPNIVIDISWSKFWEIFGDEQPVLSTKTLELKIKVLLHIEETCWQCMDVRILVASLTAYKIQHMFFRKGWWRECLMNRLDSAIVHTNATWYHSQGATHMSWLHAFELLKQQKEGKVLRKIDMNDVSQAAGEEFWWKMLTLLWPNQSIIVQESGCNHGIFPIPFQSKIKKKSLDSWYLLVSED